MTSAPLVALTSTTRPASNRKRQVANDLAVDGKRQRGANDAFRAQAMRRREHLLRGHVHDLDEAPRRHLGSGLPARLGHQADREIGSGPGEADAIEAALVEQLGARLKARDVLSPRGHRVWLVETRRDRNRLPQPLHVRLAEDHLRPARVRVADDRPGDPAVAHRLQ